MKLEFVTTRRGTKTPRLVLTETEYADEREEGSGMCCACGEAAYGVEPDARRYKCEACGEPRVYGIEELLVMNRIRFVDDAEVEGDDEEEDEAAE